MARHQDGRAQLCRLLSVFDWPHTPDSRDSRSPLFDHRAGARRLIALNRLFQLGQLILSGAVSLLGGKPSDALVPVVTELSALALAALLAGTCLAFALLFLASLAIPLLSGLGNIGELVAHLLGGFFILGLPFFLAEAVVLVAVVVAATVVGVRPRVIWPVPRLA